MRNNVDAKQIALNLLIGGNAAVALCCLMTPGLVYKLVALGNVIAIIWMLRFVED